jgi:hypothetical protein
LEWELDGCQKPTDEIDIWRSFDRKFAERFDYSIWRKRFRGFGRPGAIRRVAPKVETGVSNLSTSNRLVADVSKLPAYIRWGTFAALAGIGFKKPTNYGIPADDLANLLAQVEQESLLPECPASCLVTKLVFAGQIVQLLTVDDRSQRALGSLVHWILISIPDRRLVCSDCGVKRRRGSFASYRPIH